MDCETKLWLVVLFFLFSATYCVVGVPQVPCLFIFGDSLSDSGNNNNLNTEAKANHMPYGVDFPSGPTGRFTNGRTSVDIITQLLGFDQFIPPYANTNGTDITLGVNYASGGAGIRNETGTHMGEDIGFGLQVQHHRDILSQITQRLGTDNVQQHLNKCLYYVNIGNNDYLNNYFLPQHYTSNRNYTTEQYATALAEEYSTYVKALYELGARKFSLVGLNLIGCIPYEISTHGKNDSMCVQEESQAAQLFNEKLRALVDRYNKELAGAKFIYVNSAFIKYSNFKLPDTVICCKYKKNGLCIPNEESCPGRHLHPFFDAFHPTEKVNLFTATSAYKSTIPSYTYPMDISELAKL